MQINSPLASHVRTLRNGLAPFARSGYAARGLIYFVIGFYAALAGLGRGEGKSSHSALQTIMDNFAGDLLAWLLMVGLLSYSLWRLTQSILDPDNHGAGMKGLAIRSGLLASAGTYAALLVYTFALWQGSRSSSGGDSAFAEKIAGFVGTRYVAWFLVAVFIGVGAAHFIKAIRRTYARYFDAPPPVMAFIHPIARIGLLARGAIFFVTALLFAYRGLNDGGGSNAGIGAALSFIQGLPAGGILLAIAGLGLLTFALYSFSEAAWRRIDI